MAMPKLKFLLCVALSLSFLVVPFALEFTPSGKAYALGGGGGRGSDNSAPLLADGFQTQRIQTAYTLLPQECTPGANCPNTSENQIAHKVPNPATFLLVGLGLGGIAIFRKKFKK